MKVTVSEFSSKRLGRKAFIQWRKTVDPRQLFFCWWNRVRRFCKALWQVTFKLSTSIPSTQSETHSVWCKLHSGNIWTGYGAYRSSSLAPQLLFGDGQCFNTQRWPSGSTSSWKEHHLRKTTTIFLWSESDRNGFRTSEGIIPPTQGYWQQGSSNSVSFQWFLRRGNPKLLPPLLEDTVSDDIKIQMQT